ncbi:MAG: zinc metallopeptidase [SAR86 cluster bacterium]|nr:zinc metallopeptidase [SAR86 cluster bacterium]
MVFYLFIFFIVFFLPKIWLSYAMKKNDKELENMPFNAAEFGKLILKENSISDVIIEETELIDHYDLNEKKVRVQKGRLAKKSLTSIAIVCHEIGHAIQHKEQYGPLMKRTKIVEKTQWISRIGGVILYSGLPLILATGSFGLIKICLIAVLVSVLLGVFIHLITLDVEIDASFKKAMPILQEKIPSEYHQQCKSVLNAAAFTYIIGALTSFLSLRYIWLLLTRLR